MDRIEDLDPEIIASYTFMRVLPDGRICGVHRLMFHWTVHIGLDHVGYEDRYCFLTEEMALKSLIEWNGEGDMPGDWHRHPKTGRRRNIETGEEWIAD